MTLGTQVVWLFIMAIPIACIAWTVTQEELFREPREYCERQSQEGRSLPRRKFFYLLTCEYCFSHYVAAFFLVIMRYKLLYQDWRGYIIGGFALVWVANQYMSLYNHLRLDLKKGGVERAEGSGTAAGAGGSCGAAGEQTGGLGGVRRCSFVVCSHAHDSPLANRPMTQSPPTSSCFF